MYQCLLIRYGEISLKGRNRSKFEHILLKNIENALKGIPHGSISKTYGRMYVETKDNWEQLAERLSKVFGLVSLSPALVRPLDLDAIKEAALTVMDDEDGRTFKVHTKRPNKSFPLNSPALNEQLGEHILRNRPHLAVDVHQPSRVLNLEIRQEGAYVYSRVIPCIGGLPVGCSGKALLLLSGGLDSPVAGYLSLKRGVDLEGLHFYSYPFTTERSKEKVVDLARILAGYSGHGRINLWIVHFTEIQKAIQKTSYPEQKITVMRRMMLRIGEALAQREKALALVTGESLGQVASQTMESIATISAAAQIPIFRPLIGFDKQEIIDISHKIGTYQTSILPYDDCCTVFVPKSPATKPTIEQALRAEQQLDVQSLVDEAVARTERIVVHRQTDWS